MQSNILRKLFYLTLILFASSYASFGQNSTRKCVSEIDTLTLKRVYSHVDVMPSPRLGSIELFEQLGNLTYPPSCIQSKSKFVVAFIVDETGQISGQRIIQNIQGTRLGEQALTIIENIEWNPGECNGKKVSVIYILPVRINLNSLDSQKSLRIVPEYIKK